MNNQKQYVYVQQPDGSYIAVEQPVAQPVAPPAPPVNRGNTARREKLDKAASTCFPWAMLVAAAVFSLLFCHFGVINHSIGGVGYPIAIAVFYLIFTPFILTRDHRPRWQSLLLLVPIAALQIAFVFIPRSFGTALFSFCLMIAQLVFMGRCSESPLVSFRGIGDIFRVTLGYTFGNIAGTYSSLGKKRSEDSKKSGTFVKVLIGIGIALPVMLVLIILLSVADPAFGDVIGKIFDFINFNIINEIGVVILAVPMTLLLFPYIMTLRSGYAPERSKGELKRWCDPTVAAIVSFAASLVYILFIIVEIKYLFVGNVLPEGFASFAEYARQGVFELCFATVLTFAAVIFFTVFAKKDENGKTSLLLRVALSLVTVCSMVVVISAFYRLCCDVYYFGLTVNRIFAFVFTAFLAVSLLILLCKQWVEKLPVASSVVAVGICLLTVFSCCGADRICAEYNVDRYLRDGTKIDMNYIAELDYSAAPAVEKLYNNAKDEKIKEQALGLIAYYYYNGGEVWEDGSNELTKQPLGNWTVAAQQAVNAFERCGSPKPECMDVLKDFDIYAYDMYMDEIHESVSEF